MISNTQYQVLLFCGVEVLQKCKRVPRGKSCIRSILEARKLTAGTTEVADPKMLVLLFGDHMPYANARKTS